ncbi:uncharacterized protein LOC125476069 [Pyrus x bretschneideri]|uniref:uncharacterized protein LOC125476069 n=1 Tax=Pyrus x bretschneideri TaxID=225117 RepID=UPI00202F10C2|nr:uncharacterized protein LOC125476069 [Pyrus x bretschneideri]
MKRSKRLRYKITNSSCSFSSVNESKHVTEFGEEVVERAICLMIISGCGSNWGRISSNTKSLNNNSLSLEVQSPGLKNWIMGNKGGVSVCGDTVKLVDCISVCKNVFVEKKVFEFSKNNFRFDNDEENSVDMEDRFFKGVAKLECSDNSAGEEKTKRVIENMGHKCSIYLKVFAIGQALGGHKRVHFGKDPKIGTEESRVLKQQFFLTFVMHLFNSMCSFLVS